jgi:hypothetical protein
VKSGLFCGVRYRAKQSAVFFVERLRISVSFVSLRSSLRLHRKFLIALAARRFFPYITSRE